MENQKRHEEIFVITDFGVVYYSTFWNGEHCYSAGFDLHHDVDEAVAQCSERELYLERLALLLPR